MKYYTEGDQPINFSTLFENSLPNKSKGLAIAGIILGGIGLLLGVIVIIMAAGPRKPFDALLLTIT